MTDDAKQNADAWAATISAAMAGIDALGNDTESVEFDGETFDDADALRDRLQEMPLAIDVRTGWHTPGTTATVRPSEYQILLTTGGPALRIVGDLDLHGEPDTARLEYQDWGTPWTASTVCDDNVIEFARLFYFGE